MNDKPTLNDLSAFMAIVSHRSFRKAADELELSPSSLSHMMRALERTMGARLLNRTTRSVAPTEIGEKLAASLRPALKGLDEALETVDLLRNRPSGTLRINANVTAARLLLKYVAGPFLARYPEMALDLVNDGRFVDIVDSGFDAGIRLREAIPQDMIAVPFGGKTRFIAVASKSYLDTTDTPKTPDDLLQHTCIRLRMPSGKLYRWEFERHGKEMRIDVPGTLTLDDVDLMAEAASMSLGIAYVPEQVARRYIERGDLVAILQDWCPEIDGLCLYYPGHRHVPLGLRAFITVLKEVFP
jgi:DNA-binding transcriptional LysR family regulator